MAPRTVYEIVILRVSLDSSVDLLHPDIQQTEHKILPELPDVRERNCLEQVTLRERDSMPANVNIRFTYWQVKTGDFNLLKVAKYDFEHLLIVMGEELTYYFLSNSKNQTNISGFTATPLTYCSCCLNTNYLNVIEVIKNHTIRTLIKKKGWLP
ncbi:uncharacterized protein LOC128861303 [Anastrepha ludens]|uniref:uncharacterized protein LOC128861303 n=1 Tax=Anastrepha ludens TaxID=28586 RepID=UPI0023B06DF6|nr:uncharacterized protein LOC128861303 [Anastrepha ludens]